MQRRIAFILILACSISPAGNRRVRGDDEPYTAAAAKISAATVTVRMSCAANDAKEHVAPARSDARDDRSAKGGAAQSTAPAKPSAVPLPPSVKSNAEKAIERNSATSPPSAANDAALDGSGLTKSNDEPRARAFDHVTVGSGVSLGDGWIVAALRPGAGARYRLTAPGGEQAEAEPRVIDESTSLVLLQTAQTKWARVELAAEPPAVGARMIGASAWGAESPAVSLGILGSVDRLLAGGEFPPLLQCDVHITSTSRGAGLVNRDGRLVGIVVATDNGDRAGWTYAVGADHVRRLVAARRDGQLVVLPKRRTVAGLELRQSNRSTSGGEAIVVRKLIPGGPAERAGLKAGDEVLSLDGRALHSAVEAARLVLARQPGETLEVVVRREGQTQKMAVTLAASESATESQKANSAAKSSLAGSAVPTAPEPPPDRSESPTYSNGEPVQAPLSATALAKENEVVARLLKLVGRQLANAAQLEEQLRAREAQIARLEAELARMRQASESQRERKSANSVAGPISPSPSQSPVPAPQATPAPR